MYATSLSSATSFVTKPVNGAPNTEVFLRITQSLLSIPAELEALGNELSGKPDAAKEKFRELNLEFLSKVHELKKILHELPNEDQPEVQSVITTLEQLLASTIDNNLQLSRHKMNIVHCLFSLEQRLTSSISALPAGKIFHYKMAKFKLKLEILRLRFLVGNYAFRNSYHQEMKIARDIAERLVRDITRSNRCHAFSPPSVERKLRRIYRHMKLAIQNV